MILFNNKEYLDGEIVVVELKGVLDSSTSVDLEDHVNKLLQKKKIFIILDIMNLEYISSAGIGAVIYAQKRILSASGLLLVCNVPEEIAALFKILNFDKLIKFAENMEDALQIMEKQFHFIADVESEIRQTAPEAEDEPKPLPQADVIAEIEKHPADEITGRHQKETVFDSAIILECARCKSMVRVKKSGTYICPDCKSEFVVDPDQTVNF